MKKYLLVSFIFLIIDTYPAVPLILDFGPDIAAQQVQQPIQQQQQAQQQVQVPLVSLETLDGKVLEVPRDRYCTIENVVEDTSEEDMPVPVPFKYENLARADSYIRSPKRKRTEYLRPTEIAKILNYLDPKHTGRSRTRGSNVWNPIYVAYLNSRFNADEDVCLEFEDGQELLQEIYPNTRGAQRRIQALCYDLRLRSGMDLRGKDKDNIRNYFTRRLRHTSAELDRRRRLRRLNGAGN